VEIQELNTKRETRVVVFVVCEMRNAQAAQVRTRRSAKTYEYFE
jgi:hypothetical protein